MKTGVMILGLKGATASTLVATTLSEVRGEGRGDAARFLISETEWARQLGLPDLESLCFGGWDVKKESWKDTLARHGVLDGQVTPSMLASLEAVPCYEGIALAHDHAAVTGEIGAARPDGRAILDRLRTDIADFRKRTGADRIIVISLGPPAKLPPENDWPQGADDLLDALEEGNILSAPPYYFLAAMLEGAAIADYTASATLDIPGMIAFATRARVPVAGRDGSTGQTLLKSVLADAFATRRLPIRGWYSTNILGNHDGLVLSDARYADVKRVDKTALLEPILGYPVEAHLVDIRYYLPAGDEKEAWDAIDFSTWFGGKGQLRLNWRASDSLLATPPILDLIRFLAHAQERGLYGVRPELGVFFKHALGTDERRYLKLAEALRAVAELS